MFGRFVLILMLEQHSTSLVDALRLSVPFVHEQQLFGEPEREALAACG